MPLKLRSKGLRESLKIKKGGVQRIPPKMKEGGTQMFLLQLSSLEVS